jgi:hypothetical protein
MKDGDEDGDGDDDEELTYRRECAALAPVSARSIDHEVIRISGPCDADVDVGFLGRPEMKDQHEFRIFFWSARSTCMVDVPPPNPPA